MVLGIDADNSLITAALGRVLNAKGGNCCTRKDPSNFDGGVLKELEGHPNNLSLEFKTNRDLK